MEGGTEREGRRESEWGGGREGRGGAGSDEAAAKQCARSPEADGIEERDGNARMRGCEDANARMRGCEDARMRGCEDARMRKNVAMEVKEEEDEGDEEEAEGEGEDEDEDEDEDEGGEEEEEEEEEVRRIGWTDQAQKIEVWLRLAWEGGIDDGWGWMVELMDGGRMGGELALVVAGKPTPPRSVISPRSPTFLHLRMLAGPAGSASTRKAQRWDDPGSHRQKPSQPPRRRSTPQPTAAPQHQPANRPSTSVH